MNVIYVIGVAIGVASFGGAAYLLSVWHEDQRSGTRGWPLSRVIAYLAIAGTLASNTLGAVTLLRLAGVENFRAMQLALTPLTLTAILTLDALFTILALYLRVIRARSGKRAL